MRVGGATPWPDWLEATPRSESSWVYHLHGELDWKNLLQDGIANILLLRSRSIGEILKSFIDCGEFEAVIEGCKFPEFEDPSVEHLIDQARESIFRMAEIEREVYEIDQKLTTLLGQNIFVEKQKSA